MTGAWPKRLISVPVSALAVDASITSISAHGYTQAEIREIVRLIPDVYDKIRNGVTETEILAMRFSKDRRAQAIAETYSRLFRDVHDSSTLKAELNGHQLKVVAGNHRVRAARDSGVRVVPVVVSAPTDQILDRVEEACGSAIRSAGYGRHPLGARTDLSSRSTRSALEVEHARERGSDTVPIAERER